jgi:hypothetical protein
MLFRNHPLMSRYGVPNCLRFGLGSTFNRRLVLPMRWRKTLGEKVQKMPSEWHELGNEILKIVEEGDEAWRSKVMETFKDALVEFLKFLSAALDKASKRVDLPEAFKSAFPYH